MAGNKFICGNIILFTSILIFANFSNIFAEEPGDYISISTAAFDILQNDAPSVEGRLEYRVNSIELPLKPFIGFMANTDGGRYIYSGLFFEISLTTFFNLVPSIASGVYIKNFSKDLHSLLEFRSQLEAIFILTQDLKAGISFCHISNASLGDANPGVESVAFTVQISVP